MTFSSCFLMHRPSLPVQDCYSHATSDVLADLGARQVWEKMHSTGSCTKLLAQKVVSLPSRALYRAAGKIVGARLYGQ